MGKLDSLLPIIRLASRIAAREDVEQDDVDWGDDLENTQDEPTDGSSDELQVDPDSQSDLDTDMTAGSVEYSCRMDLSIDASFEGNTSKNELLSKIKLELKNAIKLAMQKVATDLSLASADVKVKPIVTECAVIDDVDEGLDEFGQLLDVDGSDEDEESEDEESEDEESEDEESEDEESEDEESEDEESEDEDEGPDYQY